MDQTMIIISRSSALQGITVLFLFAALSMLAQASPPKRSAGPSVVLPLELKGVRLGEARSRIELDMGAVDCAPDAENCTVHPYGAYATLAGHKVSYWLAKFHDRKLVQLTAIMDADGALAAAAALQAKYGKPDIDVATPKMNGFGASFIARVISWDESGDSILAATNRERFGDGVVVLSRATELKEQPAHTRPDI